MTGLVDLQRRALKRTYFEIARLARRDERWLGRHARAGRVLVLNLHSVSPRPNPFWPSLHPDVFRELAAWLQTHCTLTLFRQLTTSTAGDERPLAILSFDDGYADFVEYAMPVLDELGLAANQNVIGDAVETGRAPWTVRFLDFLGSAPPSAWKEARVPGFDRAAPSEDPLARERYGAALSNHIKVLPPSERASVVAELDGLMEAVGLASPRPMMSAADIEAASAAGHEIGAHSYSHESMEFLDDRAFVADLERCRAVLGAAGRECDVYAFPNGSCRPSQLELLPRHGIRHALLVGERPSTRGATVHTRITVRGDSTAEARARAAGLVP